VMAVELGPIRVNAVSPGVINTPWWTAPTSTASQLLPQWPPTNPSARSHHGVLMTPGTPR